MIDKIVSLPALDVIDGILTPVLLTDDQGFIIYANSASLDLFGTPLTKKPLASLLSGGDSESIELLSQCQNKDMAQTCIDHEILAITHDKQTIPMQISLNHTYDHAGKTWYICHFTDLTAHKNHEKKLINNEKRSLLALHFAHIGFWEWDIAGNELHWSEEIAPMFGYEQHTTESTYDNFIKAIHPHDRDLVKDAVNRAITSNIQYDIEHRVVWQDGTIHWVHEKGDVIRDVSGNAERMIGVVQDITKQKLIETELIAAKEKAEAAMKTKNLFMNNMGHEIRTPFNSILGMSELLLNENLTDEQKKQVETISSAAKTFLDSIENILRISGIENHTVALKPELFHFAPFLEKIHNTIVKQLEHKPVRFTLNKDKELHSCYFGDSTQLEQILLNLLGNAAKFTEKGDISLSIWPQNRTTIHFHIEDTGIGMTREELRSCFIPFYQADTSRTRKHGGMGLGISISRGLIELMDGKIWIFSKKNQGTKIHFYVELNQHDCSRDDIKKFQSHDKDPSPKTGQQKINIAPVLIVDDIESNLKLTKLNLERKGYRVLSAHNGQEAIELFIQENPSIILMDVQMPVMDGIDATKRIRLTEKGKNVPIIAMSGDTSPSAKEQYFKAGMNEAVSKPINFDDLFTLVGRFIEGTEKPDDTYASETHDESNLIDVPGFDIPQAFKLWQDEKAYTTALKNFILDHGESGKLLKQYIINKKYSEAHSLNHALKGLTGNLCGNELAGLFTSIQNLLETKKISQAIPLAEQVHELIEKAKPAIQKIKLVEPKKSKAQFSSSTVTLVIGNLLNALDQDNPDTVNPLLKELDSYLPDAILDKVQYHNDRFEFNEAKQELLRLMKKLDISSELSYE